MRINRGRRIEQAKSLSVIVKLSCLLLLSQSGPAVHRLNAQTLTRADLQAQTAIYEAASKRAQPPEMSAVQAGRIWTRLGMLYQDAGTLYQDATRYQEAENAFERAIRLLSLPPVSKSDLSAAIDDVGTLYLERGHVGDAEQAEMKALRLREELGDQHQLALSWYHLAILNMRKHRAERAHSFAGQAVSELSSDSNATPEDRIGALFVLSQSLCLSHNYLRAIETLQNALHLVRTFYGPKDFPAGLGTFLLGYAYWKAGDRSSAGEFMREGSEVIGQQLGWEHPAYLSVMTQYARFLRQTHQRSAARQVEEQVKQTRARLDAASPDHRYPETMDIAALY
jgi:tetratricopeptide (TPR) repeat protein